jgi:hypothetical protein
VIRKAELLQVMEQVENRSQLEILNDIGGNSVIKKPCSFEHIRYPKYSVIHCYRCGGHRKVEKTEIGQEMKKRVDQAKAEMREKCWTEPDCDLRFTYVEKEQVEPQTYSVNGKEYKRIHRSPTFGRWSNTSNRR